VSYCTNSFLSSFFEGRDNNALQLNSLAHLLQT